MKITALIPHLLDHKLDRAFESASMRFDRRQHCLVELVCDDGTIGWGECLGPALPNAAILRFCAPHLIGRDPLQIGPIWHHLYNVLRDQGQRGLAITALSGIDIALWDIAGKRYGAPVSQLLAGRFRDRVQAYATGGFRTDDPDRAAVLAAETGRYAAEGFHAVKIKIGFNVEDDLRCIAAVRAAIGPQTKLMIDANHGYDVLEAITLGQRAAVYDIDWFEEPVIPEQLAAYRDVRAGQPLPVAGGETWHSVYGMAEPLASRAIDIIQPDVCGIGGFSEFRRVVDLAGLHGVRVIPHVWGTGVALAAGLQALAALPDTPPRREPRQPILEFDRTPNPFRQAILTQPLDHVGGWVAIPNGPGLGIEINRAALSAFAWAGQDAP